MQSRQVASWLRLSMSSHLTQQKSPRPYENLKGLTQCGLTSSSQGSFLTSSGCFLAVPRVSRHTLMEGLVFLFASPGTSSSHYLQACSITSFRSSLGDHLLREDFLDHKTEPVPLFYFLHIFIPIKHGLNELFLSSYFIYCFSRMSGSWRQALH